MSHRRVRNAEPGLVTRVARRVGLNTLNTCFQPQGHGCRVFKTVEINRRVCLLYPSLCCSYSRYRTYQQLHQLLSGYDTHTTPDQIDEVLQARIDVLRNLREPFGKPNAESRKRVDNGSVR